MTILLISIAILLVAILIYRTPKDSTNPVLFFIFDLLDIILIIVSVSIIAFLIYHGIISVLENYRFK